MDRTVQLLANMWSKLQNECNDVVTEENYDALKKAIKALEQQPCDDAISRKAAFDAMREETCGCCWDAKDILAHLPSVSTGKTGEWIFVQYDFDPRIGNWHCSECKNIIYQGVEKKGIHSEVIYKFCPNCGAKMGVEE